MNSQHLSPIYHRNQVESTLWQVFLKRRQRPTNAPVPRVFLNRIKRFLDIDAKIFDSKSGFAFVSDPGDGLGSTRGFSLYDMFILGLALDFSDAGYPQQDIVFLLQHTRKLFEGHFTQAIAYPTWQRDLRAAKDVPTAPTISSQGIEIADMRMFLVIQKNEILEVFDPKHVDVNKTHITVPSIFTGFSELAAFLEQDMGYRQHHHFIVEFAQLAVELRDMIIKAPVTKRGRKPSVKTTKENKTHDY